MDKIKFLIVTGGASGIGNAIIEQSKKDYQEVYNLGIQAHNRRECNVKDFHCNIRDGDAVKKTMETIIADAKAEYHLLSNAGIFIPTDFLNQTAKEIKTVIDLNFTGNLFVLQAFINRIEETNSFGRIVVVNSISATYPGGSMMTVYSATKAAMLRARKDLSNYPQIAINAIRPGKDLVKKGQACKVSADHLVDIIKEMFFKWPESITGTDLVIDCGVTAKKGRF